MAVCPTFINRVNIALAEDTALIFLGAPAGGIVDGQVQEVEVMRAVMTFKMLREASAVFAAKVNEIDAAEREAQNRLAAEERQSFRDRLDEAVRDAGAAKH